MRYNIYVWSDLMAFMCYFVAIFLWNLKMTDIVQYIYIYVYTYMCSWRRPEIISFKMCYLPLVWSCCLLASFLIFSAIWTKSSSCGFLKSSSLTACWKLIKFNIYQSLVVRGQKLVRPQVTELNSWNEAMNKAISIIKHRRNILIT